MDHVKTGALIAKRRGELGFTQKVLADQLNISDRAVSRWERGLGFPDISLMEPLADALGLTVLELLHGEEEKPSPEAEFSAREMLNNIQPEVQKKMQKTYRWIVALGILLVVAAAILIWTISGAVDWRWEAVAKEDAAAVSEETLITEQEYELMHVLYQEFLAPEGENAWEAEAKAYREDPENYIHPEADLESTSYNISIQKDSVTVTYGVGEYLCRLTVLKKGGIVQKTLMMFGQDVAQVSNSENDQFRAQIRETGLAALFD